MRIDMKRFRGWSMSVREKEFKEVVLKQLLKMIFMMHLD